MQQHSQIAVLKDRLLQALDDQFNVININEVTRVISVLEKTNVTREDLEKTRLGRDINELRRKTADKELAKRAKKLIKKWLDLTSSSLPAGTNSTTTNSNSDSTPSSRYASPSLPAFTFSNDSRDSNSFQSHRNSYSNGRDGSTPPDTNDEDSNSSVFSSSLSNDAFPHTNHINSRSLLGSPSPSLLTNGNSNHATLINSSKKQSPASHQQQQQRNGNSRKRKHESETDALRDNLNSIMNSSAGRRLQSTQELAEKFNIKINRPSLSASSSPQILSFTKDGGSPSAKRNKLSRNGTYKNGFHPHDENSLGAEIESAILKNHHNQQHHNNKSLPASPALLSLRTKSAHSATTSPAVQSHQSSACDVDDSESYSKSSFSKKHKHKRKSRQPSPVDDSMNSVDYAAKAKQRRAAAGPTITDVDRDIMNIYAQLPQINPDDIEMLKKFKFDADDEQLTVEPQDDKNDEVKRGTTEGDQPSGELLAKVKDSEIDEKMSLIGEEDEYELFEYNEEYEEEEEEEVEVTDDEASLEDDDDEEDVKSETIPELRLIGKSIDDEVRRTKACDKPPHTEAFNFDDDEDDVHAPEISHRNSMGDIFSKCDKSAAAVVDSSCGPIGPSGDHFKSNSKSTRGYEQPDSTISCDSNENAISSSTVKQEEPDSTTSFMDVDDEVEECGSPTTTSAELAPSTPVTPTTTCTPLLPYQTDALSIDCVKTEPTTVPASSSAVASTKSPLDALDLFYDAEEFMADMELLSESCFSDPSNPFYAQFPPAASFVSQIAGNPLPPSITEKQPTTSRGTDATEATTQETKSTNDISEKSATDSQPSAIDVSANKSEPSPMATSSSDDDSDADEEDADDSDSGQAAEEQQQLQTQPREEPVADKIDMSPKPPRRKRTKRVIVTVLKKKYRKCFTRSKVKKAIIDRLANEQWEGVNGNFGQDGAWHEFGEMTSAYVLTGGINSSNTAEENVLHILPYVNYTW